MAVETVRKETLAQIMDKRGLNVSDMVKMTGLGTNVLYRAVHGGDHHTSNASAGIIARALGLKANQIAWLYSLADSGRPPLSGGAYTAPHPIKPKCCPECFLLLPASGVCGTC